MYWYKNCKFIRQYPNVTRQLPISLPQQPIQVYYYYSLIFGLAFSGCLVAVHAGLWFAKLKKEPPYILDVALLVYFSIFLALYLTLTANQLLLNLLLNITIHGWLAGVMLVCNWVPLLRNLAHF